MVQKLVLVSLPILGSQGMDLGSLNPRPGPPSITHTFSVQLICVVLEADQFGFLSAIQEFLEEIRVSDTYNPDKLSKFQALQ